MFVDLEGKASYRPDWMRSSYDFSTVVPESRRMTYGGNYVSSVDMEISYDWFGYGEAECFRIFDTGNGMLLMAHRYSA